jgi:predicted nuclease of predicted toxin-antitoxin system
MNLSPLWVEQLVLAGHEARHWSSIGEPGAADSEILLYVRDLEAILLTHDLDFGAILARTQATSPSVVQLRGQDLDPQRSAPLVLEAIELCQSDLRSGALLTVDVRKRTARVLPLRH